MTLETRQPFFCSAIWRPASIGTRPTNRLCSTASESNGVAEFKDPAAL